MFQSFTTTANRDAGPARLQQLQGEMNAEGITAFLVPHADEHQNEYLPERAERLSWLTGFTGSAGFAIATLKSCIVFTDGRYTLQVVEQIHPDAFKAEDITAMPPSKWLEENTTAEDVIGFDPWLITLNQVEAYKKAVKKSGAHLKPVSNLIDLVWKDQPEAPLGRVHIHDETFAGRSAEEKIKQIQQKITDKSADATVLTDPASLAWLFNIRGTDVVHNPLALGFAIVPAIGKPMLFLDDRKFDAETKSSLENIADLQGPENFETKLAEVSNDNSILCDPNLVPIALGNLITDNNGKIIKGRDPVVLPRALKNKTELQGAREAHIVDGVAMCKFLFWLDQQKPETLTEISAAKMLETLRRENALAMGSELKEISFDTISGHGPNGAIVHYRVTEDSDRRFTDNALYLCDSGGQYLNGTTDITRTIAIGSPPRSAITDFTLVLKGHIAIAMARFPKSSRGVDIDVLARHALWQHGKDFAHGTGHGVGSFMNVHEGPQSISKRGMEPLQPGMIISNEPGYYVENEYGIRIENLVIVSEPKQLDGGNIETHDFETITLCPIDLRLVETKLLLDHEREWLNAYHLQVLETLSPHLSEEEVIWLKHATRAI